MRTKILISVLLGLVLVHNNAIAALDTGVCIPAACSNDALYANETTVSNCDFLSAPQCYGLNKVNSCGTCKSGYKRVEKTVALTHCSQGSTTYYDCEFDYIGGGGGCNGVCDDCISDTFWSTIVTGYEGRTTRTCNTQTCLCTERSEYRCSAGYYGSLGAAPCRIRNGVYECSGCTACPASSGGNQTSQAGATTNAECYVPAQKSEYDTTGTFHYTDKCFY